MKKISEMSDDELYDAIIARDVNPSDYESEPKGYYGELLDEYHEREGHFNE